MALGGIAQPAEAAQNEPPPRLLLLLTIDQGRGDYLDRFAPTLTGGLARLAREGVTFADTHHAHAYTVTAAGHAALSTGRHPSGSGMVGNNFYDRAEARWVYCMEDHAQPVLLPEGANASRSATVPANGAILFIVGLSREDGLSLNFRTEDRVGGRGNNRQPASSPRIRPPEHRERRGAGPARRDDGGIGRAIRPRSNAECSLGVAKCIADIT